MSATKTRMSDGVRRLVKDPAGYVDGRWLIGGDEELDAIDPTTEQVLACVPSTALTQVDDAVTAARRAFDEGPWPRMRPRDRAAAINRLIDRLRAHRDDLVELGMLEVGSPRMLSEAMHADLPINFWEWFADAAIRGPRGGWEDGIGLHHSPVLSTSILFHDPIGVVAAIAAYNTPQLITAFKVGGALAAGCTVVLMPSPRTPLAAVAFARIVEEADLPPGVVNVVLGEAEVGRALTEHPAVDLVTFTGSVSVGRQVMRQAANGLKKVVLELGGKSPNILLPGADVEAAAAPSILRFTRNSGQACGATTRTFVPRADYDRFVAAAANFMDTVVVGDPFEPSTVLGPLIRRAQVDSVQGYVDRAVGAGAEIVAGGKPVAADTGFFMSPALIGGVSNDAEICQEELFGPVGAVIAYDSVDEAVALANASRYGLNANVWGPADEAMRVARRLRTGTATINGGGGDRPDAPWGGVGESGVGFDRGEAGFAEFFTVQHVQWPLAGVGRASGLPTGKASDE
ncbi:MAG: aldehyde dehydrogenase family protein [Actinomycetota bacterium]